MLTTAFISDLLGKQSNIILQQILSIPFVCFCGCHSYTEGESTWAIPASVWEVDVGLLLLALCSGVGTQGGGTVPLLKGDNCSSVWDLELEVVLARTVEELVLD